MSEWRTKCWEDCTNFKVYPSVHVLHRCWRWQLFGLLVSWLESWIDRVKYYTIWKTIPILRFRVLGRDTASPSWSSSLLHGHHWVVSWSTPLPHSRLSQRPSSCGGTRCRRWIAALGSLLLASWRRVRWRGWLNDGEWGRQSNIAPGTYTRIWIIRPILIKYDKSIIAITSFPVVFDHTLPFFEKPIKNWISQIQ